MYVTADTLHFVDVLISHIDMFPYADLARLFLRMAYLERSNECING